MEKQMLLILRGIAGSGKSTFAKQWVADDESHRARINRDYLRMQMFGRYSGLSRDEENAVTVAQKASVRALLRAGRSVVVDDTNLYLPAARDWADIAVEEGANWSVRDFDVPLEVCLARNAARDRDRVVPEGVVRKMHDKFVNRKVIEPRVPTVVRYVPDKNLPKAFICDADGTLCRHVSRSPYDYSRVSEDEVIEPVAQMVRDLSSAGYEIIIMSGREDSCKDDTIRWLDKFRIPFDEIHMRSTGDQRKDSVIKAELFDNIRDRYNVVGWIDDREQVVQMVRDRLGITVYQVDWGRF